MAHRTQLYLDDSQFHYIWDLARTEGKSIAQIVRDWIEEKRRDRVARKYAKDPFIKARGIFNSGQPHMAGNFDDYLYGDKKR